MSVPDPQFNRRFVFVVLGSFLFFAGLLVLRVGLDATPYETVDSAGRTMGFNDPLGREHYLIMVQNFAPLRLFSVDYWYEWLLVLMQGIGAWLLLSPRRSGTRGTRWFFALQLRIFPFGLLCIPLLFPMAIGLFTPSMTMDRESFVDVPFLIITAQPVWVLASIWMVIGLTGPGLGFSKCKDVFMEALRAGRRKATEVFR